jgi:pimeloyl-ACP methyl ester carboxylesterase
VRSNRDENKKPASRAHALPSPTLSNHLNYITTALSYNTSKMSAATAPSSAARAAVRTTTIARPPSLLLRKPSSSLSARRASVLLRAAREGEVEVRPGVYQGYWTWKPESMPGEAHRIRYVRSDGSSDEGGEGSTSATTPTPTTPPLVFVHGFGSNADQFRKQVGRIRPGTATYAVDLLGYGLSDKPDPREREPNSLYNFGVWGELLVDFLDEVALATERVEGAKGAEMAGQKQQQPQQHKKAFFAANSVGGLAALEAALRAPQKVAGVQVINISLRGLHVDRQPSWQRPLVAAFQRLLRDTPLGEAFFASVAQPQTVRNILRQAYGAKEAVTDELVDCILSPGLQPGAARVFLDFISYSGGPLPEKLMARLPSGKANGGGEEKVPLSILWGKEDPWENCAEGKKLFEAYAEEFVELPGLGHCPMDESPERVNPLIRRFVERHAGVAEGAAVAAAAARAI